MTSCCSCSCKSSCKSCSSTLTVPSNKLNSPQHVISRNPRCIGPEPFRRPLLVICLSLFVFQYLTLCLCVPFVARGFTGSLLSQTSHLVMCWLGLEDLWKTEAKPSKIGQAKAKILAGLRFLACLPHPLHCLLILTDSLDSVHQENAQKLCRLDSVR